MGTDGVTKDTTYAHEPQGVGKVDNEKAISD